jgi:hypothetical protein
MMNGKNNFRIYDSKTREDLKRETEKIIKELELYGRSINNCAQVNKVLSRRFGEAVKEDILVFAWNPYSKKSIVVLHPSFRLIRFGNTHVSFLKKEESIKK